MSVINLSQDLLVLLMLGAATPSGDALLKCIGAARRPVTQRSRFVQLVSSRRNFGAAPKALPEPRALGTTSFIDLRSGRNTR